MEKIKKLKLGLIMLLMSLSCMTLVACGPQKPNIPEGGGSSIIDSIYQNDITMSVSATFDKININIKSLTNIASGNVVNVVAVNSNEYISSEEFKGVSTDMVDISDATKIVGQYTLGTDSTISIDRYVIGSNFDRIYNKFYITTGTRILKGPLYASSVTAINSPEPQLNIRSKKGVLGEDPRKFADLNCSYTAINLDITRLIYPNEMFDENDEKIELYVPNNAIEFVSNGKKYYFNKERVNYFDKYIKSYYDQGAHVTAIVYASNLHNSPNFSELFPQKMTYLPWSTQAPLLALNTSNAYGMEYYIAVMEFLASRYSDNALQNGYIANYVLGNEVDYAHSYNRISEKQAEFNTYMEEYYRALRLANFAVKKYNANVSINVPFTQAWANPGHVLEDPTMVQSYAPKAMIDWLNQKSKSEGDFDWGIAPHCYTYGLAQTPVYLNDTVNGKNAGMTNSYETTTKLTFSNIEVVDAYLKQDNLKYNGNVRSVWLTEQGVSNLDNTEENLNTQAGMIASLWYKLSQIDSIKAFIYYRLIDNVNEAITPGLITVEGDEKPAYQVYKYIDTQYSKQAAKGYEQYIKYVDKTGALKTATNYNELLDVFDSGWFNGEFDWSKATPITAGVVYEWEDKIDLSNVKFESKNYLYDGTAKSIAVTNMPDGVTVTYDVEPQLTQVGTKTILATLFKDGEVVGHRQAKLTVSHIATNKIVYKENENIFVTVNLAGVDINTNAWIGIYAKGQTPGANTGYYSYYYFYPNQFSDKFIRTYNIKDYPNKDNKQKMPKGECTIYYFSGINGDYNYFASVDITIVSNSATQNSIDLSEIKFGDNEFEYDGTQKSLTIEGTLPQGVDVEYINNTITGVDTNQAVAVFKKDGVELERRYAVISVYPKEYLSTNKTTYFEGETVYVTAFAKASSQLETWWVGVYLENENDYPSTTSIYWYYVKDSKHVSGTAYDVRTLEFNSGRSQYKDLPAGKYKIVLFNTSGYTVQKEVPFEVIVWDVSADDSQLETNKPVYAIDEAINVTVTKPTEAVFEYSVALIKSADEVKLTNAIYSFKIDTNHVLGTSYNILDVTNIARPELTSLVHAGKYKVVLFVKNNEIVKAIKTVEIQIGTNEEQPTAGSIYTNKTQYTVGETIYVEAYAPEGDNQNYWVGLYLNGETPSSATPSIYWCYVNDNLHTSGAVYTVQSYPKGGRPNMESIPAGEYKVVLFNTGGYTVGTQIYITVVTGENA